MNNNEFYSRSLGDKGYDLITDTNAHTGPWFALHAINGDAVIASGTEANGSTVAQTIDQGDTIYGHFKTLTLTSGNLVAYRL